MDLTPGGNLYAVHVANLPCTVLAAVAATDSETYHVFINDALSPALRRQALEHELRHIDEGHLFNDVLTIEEMERRAARSAGVCCRLDPAPAVVFLDGAPPCFYEVGPADPKTDEPVREDGDLSGSLPGGFVLLT